MIVIQQGNLKAFGNESEAIFREKEEINSPILGSFNALLIFGALCIPCTASLMTFYNKKNMIKFFIRRDARFPLLISRDLREGAGAMDRSMRHSTGIDYSCEAIAAGCLVI